MIMLHDKDKYIEERGVKPKNRVWCPEGRRPKMKFETEDEARRFLKWNSGNFDKKIPSRIYWCEGCCGYHITARPEGGVGVTVNMKLPYLTEALEKDKVRVVRTVKAIYKVVNTLKQPSGYYGKSGLGKCKSILDSLNNSNNPYYKEEREELYNIVEQKRQEYHDVWMKRKYCKLIKTKLYRVLCNMEQDADALVKRYDYDLRYIMYLAAEDDYDIHNLPELFLEEWETLFQASPVSEHLEDKMTPIETYNGTDKDNQEEDSLLEGEEHGPGIQVGNQGQGL